MNALVRGTKALLGLFFDDGKLALGILVTLACTAAIANIEPAGSWLAIALLVGGTFILLVESAMRAARGQEARR